ncbi:uncharacterized protein LOC109535268 [Dendroctonus ponderosae]|uniref:Uncharacterized protein n=1 Tax=Dendroctonus ponderosae TaxID=77166 RepID=A0AAR5P7W0_DENPD|nr:uncharacterized protein LOC109535268 [Dendroctonus ponderosae]KAH1006842.1 hypothetical protein HUJ05_007535 [Dendroctonus ponderosae]
MRKFVVFFFVGAACLLSTISAGPVGRPPGNEALMVVQPPVSGLDWVKNHVGTIASGFLGFIGVVMVLAILFQPVYVYQLCYALGGCQDTLEDYLDALLKEDAPEKRRIKRDMKDSDLDYAMRIMKMAIHLYGQNTSENEVQKNQNTTDHDVERRSPVDFIEPVMLMMSTMYKEFLGDEQKKNFKKPPSIR